MNNNTTQIVPNTYKWNDNSTILFQEALATNVIKEKIETFTRTEYISDIDNMINACK